MDNDLDCSIVSWTSDLKTPSKRRKLETSRFPNLSTCDCILDSDGNCRRLKTELVNVRARLSQSEITATNLHKIRRELDEIFEREKDILKMQAKSDGQVIAQLREDLALATRRAHTAHESQIATESDISELKTRMQQEISDMSLKIARLKETLLMKHEELKIADERITLLEELLAEASESQTHLKLELEQANITIQKFITEKLLWEQRETAQISRAKELEEKLQSLSNVLSTFSSSVQQKLKDGEVLEEHLKILQYTSEILLSKKFSALVSRNQQSGAISVRLRFEVDKLKGTIANASKMEEKARREQSGVSDVQLESSAIVPFQPQIETVPKEKEGMKSGVSRIEGNLVKLGRIIENDMEMRQAAVEGTETGRKVSRASDAQLQSTAIRHQLLVAVPKENGGIKSGVDKFEEKADKLQRTIAKSMKVQAKSVKGRAEGGRKESRASDVKLQSSATVSHLRQLEPVLKATVGMKSVVGGLEEKVHKLESPMEKAMKRGEEAVKSTAAGKKESRVYDVQLKSLCIVHHHQRPPEAVPKENVGMKSGVDRMEGKVDKLERTIAKSMKMEEKAVKRTEAGMKGYRTSDVQLQSSAVFRQQQTEGTSIEKGRLKCEIDRFEGNVDKLESPMKKAMKMDVDAVKSIEAGSEEPLYAHIQLQSSATVSHQRQLKTVPKEKGGMKSGVDRLEAKVDKLERPIIKSMKMEEKAVKRTTAERKMSRPSDLQLQSLAVFRQQQTEGISIEKERLKSEIDRFEGNIDKLESPMKKAMKMDEGAVKSIEAGSEEPVYADIKSQSSATASHQRQLKAVPKEKVGMKTEVDRLDEKVDKLERTIEKAMLQSSVTVSSQPQTEAILKENGGMKSRVDNLEGKVDELERTLEKCMNEKSEEYNVQLIEEQCLDREISNGPHLQIRKQLLVKVKTVPRKPVLLIDVGNNYFVLPSDPKFFTINWENEYKDAELKMYRCCKCSKVTFTKGKMEDHVWIEHYGGSFKCPTCYLHRSFDLATRNGIRQHVKDFHPHLYRSRESIRFFKR